MEKTLISSYVLGWHPGGNKPFVALKLVNGQEHRVPVERADEVAALAAILRERPAYLFADGMIATGWERGE